MQDLYANSGESQVSFAHPPLVGEGQEPARMQGHWVLARLGKRVLRPGGLELTRRMLDTLAIGSEDRVVEFAPGLGITARMVLEKRPMSYCGVEREPAAAEYLQKELGPGGARIVLGRAEESGLPVASASVVFGEAILSMHTPEQKDRILAEALRLLAPGGRYALHELCLKPDNISDSARREIQAAMSKEIHLGVQPLCAREWVSLVEREGLKVTWVGEAPMHLLEPRRVLQDEGWKGGLRIAFKMASSPVLRHRVLAMRQLFHRFGENLGAVSIVAQREQGIA